MRGRRRRSASAARYGSRWPGPESRAPAPDRQQRHVQLAQVGHAREEVRVAGEVDAPARVLRASSRGWRVEGPKGGRKPPWRALGGRHAQVAKSQGASGVELVHAPEPPPGEEGTGAARGRRSPAFPAAGATRAGRGGPSGGATRGRRRYPRTGRRAAAWSAARGRRDAAAAPGRSARAGRRSRPRPWRGRGSRCRSSPPRPHGRLERRLRPLSRAEAAQSGAIMPSTRSSRRWSVGPFTLAGSSDRRRTSSRLRPRSRVVGTFSQIEVSNDTLATVLADPGASNALAVDGVRSMMWPDILRLLSLQG